MEKKLSNALKEGGKAFAVASGLVLSFALIGYLFYEMFANDNIWPAVATIILVPTIGATIQTYLTTSEVK